MLTGCGKGDSELSVLLVDDGLIHELNRQYRNMDRPTDVLSFAMQEGEFADLAQGILGDVIVSIPTAQRQAKAAKRELLDEVTFLLAHGILHLLGYDHRTDEDHRRMTRETKRLVALAQVPVARRSGET
jgi:probable rRNA maturation factor